MKTEPVTITFQSTLYTLGKSVIVRLPESESEKLPSRGQVAVDAVINDQPFTFVLEPDGYWGHWIRMTPDIVAVTGLNVGDEASITLTTTKRWPEPTIPSDIQKALDNAPEKVKTKWSDITAMARWEWIRWVNSTGNQDTRAIRIEKTISKLNGSHRRPCCFNLAACTDPELSRSGRLMQTTA